MGKNNTLTVSIVSGQLTIADANERFAAHAYGLDARGRQQVDQHSRCFVHRFHYIQYSRAVRTN
jgi:hypothetical protein